MSNSGTRQRNGEGDKPVLRPDGRWQARVSYTKPDGTRARKYVYGRTPDQCIANKQAILSDRHRGLPIHSGPTQTVSGYLEKWLAGRRDLSANVAESYAGYLRKHIGPSALGKMRLERVQPSDVRVFINALLDGGLAGGSVRRIMAVVTGGYKTAVLDGLVARNPCTGVRLPKPGKPKIDTLTPAQVRRLWEAAKSDPLYALYVLAPTLGARKGEWLALKWSAVILDGSNPHIKIEASAKRVKGQGIVIGPPKSDAAYRIIPLDDQQVRVLKAHRVRQNEERLRAEVWLDGDYVFPDAFGRVRDARTVHDAWKNLLKTAGLSDTRFHALRHTAFSRMADAEVNPSTVQQIAGHSDVRVTLTFYTHPTDDLKRKAISRLHSLYESESPDESTA